MTITLLQIDMHLPSQVSIDGELVWSAGLEAKASGMTSSDAGERILAAASLFSIRFSIGIIPIWIDFGSQLRVSAQLETDTAGSISTGELLQ